MPTVNEPPATPTKRPVTRKCQNSVAREMSQIGNTVDSMRMKKTMRPPKRSVHMPSGRRIREPVSTGIATRMPNCVSFRPRVCLIGMPITANIIHTMKHTVKAVVLAVTTDQALYACDAIACPLRRGKIGGSLGSGAGARFDLNQPEDVLKV